MCVYDADAAGLAAALALPLSPHSYACVDSMWAVGAPILQTVEVALVPGTGQVGRGSRILVEPSLCKASGQDVEVDVWGAQVVITGFDEKDNVEESVRAARGWLLKEKVDIQEKLQVRR